MAYHVRATKKISEKMFYRIFLKKWQFQLLILLLQFLYIFSSLLFFIIIFIINFLLKLFFTAPANRDSFEFKWVLF